MQATMRVEIDDETLVERARRGDAAAFEELVHRYADRLHAVVLRLVSNEQEAQEATQETFLRAWRGIGRFKGESQFFTWLYRIGVNEANRRLKRGGANATDQSLEDLTHEPRDLRPGPAGQSEVHDLREALEAAVRALPPGYRAPLVLRDIEGLSTDQAAAIMDLDPAAFKSRLHRARLSVRGAVEAYL
jgi:RNA polymerase sigma-70 factor (ECF subfamily)